MSGEFLEDPAEHRRRLQRFRAAYAVHRSREGREAVDLAALPHLTTGPLAPAWRIRARSFACFVRRVLRPAARRLGRPLVVLDLGAGNGWLCYRVQRLGHRPIALDLRTDRVDGLGAASGYASHLERLFPRIAASFEALPLAPGSADLAVYNASLHYALDLAGALAEALRVLRPEGRLAILDSPFYPTAADGEAMVREKRRRAAQLFGDLAEPLTSLAFIEYLTPERLARASAGRIAWRRHRVWYPWRYELRPWIARLRRGRRPSRFDVWEGRLHPPQG